MVFVPSFRLWLRGPGSVSSRLFLLRAGSCGDSSGPLFRMSCGSASSSGPFSVAYPTFSGCGFLTFFCFSYVFPYIFLFSFIVFFLHCTVLQGICSYEDFRRAVTRGFLLDCSSRLGIDTRYLAWCLGSLSPPYSRTIDRVWRGSVSLVPGILRLSDSDVDCQSLLDCR